MTYHRPASEGSGPASPGGLPPPAQPGCTMLQAAHSSADALSMQELQSRYDLAVALCPVPALMADVDGQIRCANAALYHLFGHDPGSLTGQAVEVLIPHSSRDRHPILRGAFAHQPAQRSMGQGREVFGLHVDGSLIPVEIGLSPVPLGADTEVFTTVVDISERRLNERRLREALDASATAMVLVAPDGTIELVNTMACELLGGAPRDLVGRNVDSFVPRHMRLQHSVFRQSYLSAPRPRAMTAARELKVVGLDGHATPVHVALTPINGVGGQRIMATLVDLTEIQAKEHELQRHNVRLSALNDELTQFAYSASHDLRAPLATIAGLLELCLEDLAAGETAETRRSIQDALTTARRNINKVEQVLTLARAGLDAIPEERIDLVAAAQAIWDDMSSKLTSRPGFIIVTRGTSWLLTERPTLVTIIENLLSNAIRFRDPAKASHWIELRFDTRSGSHLSLQITDNGTGIGTADKARVFEMFRRSAHSDGHGLGLAMVQKHVRRLAGDIRLDSSPAGSRFTLTLPLRT